MFKMGVLHAMFGIPYAPQKGIGVSENALYALGYLDVCDGDIAALEYMDSLWDDANDYHDMIREQRESGRP